MATPHMHVHSRGRSFLLAFIGSGNKQMPAKRVRVPPGEQALTGEAE